MSFPSRVKREPWQAQSQVCSCRFHLSAQPMCGQRGRVGVSRLTAASKPLTSSCGFIMLREGEKSSAQGFALPSTRSRSMAAAAMERVMPHLPNPVAT